MAKEKIATYQIFVARCFRPPPLLLPHQQLFDFEFYSSCFKSGLSELRTLFLFFLEWWQFPNCIGGTFLLFAQKSVLFLEGRHCDGGKGGWGERGGGYGEVIGTQSIAAKPLIDATGPVLQCCQVGPLISDLGLIADLFEKRPLDWSSFCLKSPLFGLKSQIFNFSSFHVKQNNCLKFSLTMEYFQIKVNLPNAGIRFWEKVWFWPQNSEFGSAFGPIFGRNLVW